MYASAFVAPFSRSAIRRSTAFTSPPARGDTADFVHSTAWLIAAYAGTRSSSSSWAAAARRAAAPSGVRPGEPRSAGSP